MVVKKTNSRLTIFCLFILLIACNSSKTNSTVTPPPPPDPGPAPLKLVWSDEFDIAGLPDSKKWNYDIGGSGWGNNELQYYTDKRSENARVENGLLIIEARKEDFSTNKFTSARLITKGKGDWQYGTLEIKAKLPKGVGTWPAIWMLASNTPLKWPDDGEIDIMEHVGFDQGRIHGTVHTQKYNHMIGTQRSAYSLVPDCSEVFHVYKLEWTSSSIKTYIDDKAFFEFQNEKDGNASWPFNKPFHLILNIAVGGNWGGQKGVDQNIWPQRMEVDYVKVWQ
jgi:beta-glucanase (GH16 family)